MSFFGNFMERCIDRLLHFIEGETLEEAAAREEEIKKLQGSGSPWDRDRVNEQIAALQGPDMLSRFFLVAFIVTAILISPFALVGYFINAAGISPMVFLRIVSHATLIIYTIGAWVLIQQCNRRAVRSGYESAFCQRALQPEPAYTHFSVIALVVFIGMFAFMSWGEVSRDIQLASFWVLIIVPFWSVVFSLFCAIPVFMIWRLIEKVQFQRIRKHHGLLNDSSGEHSV